MEGLEGWEYGLCLFWVYWERGMGKKNGEIWGGVLGVKREVGVEGEVERVGEEVGGYVGDMGGVRGENGV